jgi:hypothetical protein
MTIRITSSADWAKLKEDGLTTVLDPMIFRCGDLFLKGNPGEASDEIWDLLNKNMYALALFFDYLILAEKIPVFNYADTFDMHLDFDRRALTQINQFDSVLYDVDVGYEAYQTIKQSALAELKELAVGPAKPVAKELVDDILGELSSAEYKWVPKLDFEPEGEDVLKLYQFLLGGMIFGEYADRLESAHVVQPKRSRLMLAVALEKKKADHELEEELFKELKSRANVRADDLPSRPSLFPYLLSKADTPAQMVALAANMRKTGEVLDYREWLQERIRDWERDGKITFDAKRDVKAAANLVDYISGAQSSAPQISVKPTLTDVAGAVAGKPPVPVSIDVTAPLKRLLGWGLSSFPRKRHRKLLCRATVAGMQYQKLEHRIRTVWSSRAGTNHRRQRA